MIFELKLESDNKPKGKPKFKPEGMNAVTPIRVSDAALAAEAPAAPAGSACAEWRDAVYGEGSRRAGCCAEWRNPVYTAGRGNTVPAAGRHLPQVSDTEMTKNTPIPQSIRGSNKGGYDYGYGQTPSRPASYGNPAEVPDNSNT